MTTIAFLRSPIGLIGYEITGHADYADSGSDIVCAAISACAECILAGLTEVVKAPVMYDIDEENAGLTVCLTPECDKDAFSKAAILFDTFHITMEQLSKQYPRNLRIIYKERRKFTCST